MVYKGHGIIVDVSEWSYRPYDMADCHRAHRSDITCARLSAGCAPARRKGYTQLRTRRPPVRISICVVVFDCPVVYIV